LFSDLVGELESLCRRYGVAFNKIKIEYKPDDELPTEVSERFTDDVHNVIVLGLINSMWHTDQRKKAKYELNKRLAMFVCSPDYLKNEFEIKDIPFFRRLGERIQAVYYDKRSVQIKTKAGTDLSAIVNRKAKPGTKYYPFIEDGRYFIPGSGGDFPSGEVGFSPDECSVNGQIVFDLKIQHAGVLNDTVDVMVERDKIVKINGSQKISENYERTINSHQILRNICEISLGLNPNISIDDDIRFIPEEKKLMTMHFGHGGNYAYGDRIGPHFDGIIKDPTVITDDQEIVRDGKFCSSILDRDICDWLDQYEAVF